MQPHAQQHGMCPDIYPDTPASPGGVPNVSIPTPLYPHASAAARSGRGGGDELGSPRLAEGDAGCAHWDAASVDRLVQQEQVGRCVLPFHIPQKWCGSCCVFSFLPLGCTRLLL